MMSEPGAYEAKQLRKAMKGVGTNEKTLIEIICTRNNADMAKIKESYTEQFKRDLEKDIVAEVSGNFRKVLVSALQVLRRHSYSFMFYNNHLY